MVHSFLINVITEKMLNSIITIDINKVFNIDNYFGN